MRDPRPDDQPDPAVPGSPPALPAQQPAQQPALSWLADPPTRRHSAVLALLALPPAPGRAEPLQGSAEADGTGRGTGRGVEEAARPTPTSTPTPTRTPDPMPASAPRVSHPVLAGPLPRRAPARPVAAVSGSRAPVLDRAWARDQHTLQRLLVGLRAL